MLKSEAGCLIMLFITPMYFSTRCYKPGCLGGELSFHSCHSMTFLCQNVGSLECPELDVS